MEYIETVVTLRTYRRNGKKASKWLRKKEKEGFLFDSSESLSERPNDSEPNLMITVTKLEPFN